MEQRKYSRHKIVELEKIYADAKDDFGVLEELEEELLNRSTRRAQLLLSEVREDLDSDAEQTVLNGAVPVQAKENAEAAVSQQANTQDNEHVIDWEAVIAGAGKRAFENADENDRPLLENRPEDILDAWTALEALSPQTYKKPNDLAKFGGSVAYLKSGDEPWFKGEKARPKTQLYYAVYLGSINLEKATEKLLVVYKDERVERPSITGLAALGVVILDRNGIPIADTGLALSSFGWAYGRALAGNLDDLRHWEIAEETLKKDLEKLIYKQDKDGEDLPFSLSDAESVFHWIIRNCDIPTEDALPPNFAVRLYQSFKKGSPEPDMLNSFFLEDLQRAKHAVQSGDINKALSQYLGVTKPLDQFDILKDKRYIEAALQPKHMPLGRWPGRGRHPLVLLQQTAVNLAMLSLHDNGLFSVNGPPGTGKTTLLRDVVAAVLVERATALCSFKNTDDAFKHAGQMKLGNGFVHLYRLHDSLRGHEMVVASSNNKAVENVSKELPLQKQLAEDIDLNYFKTISNALSEGEDETWGMIAAVLGNATNRSVFSQKAWWDDDCGLRKYFYAISGQLNFESDEDGNEVIPKIVEECDPPISPEEANQRWQKARENYTQVLNKSKDINQRAQQAYDAYLSTQSLVIQVKEITAQKDKQTLQLEEVQKTKVIVSEKVKSFDVTLSKQKTAEELSLQNKLGFFKRLFARSEWKEWKEKHTKISDEIKNIKKLLKDAQDVEVKAYQHYDKCETILKGLRTKHDQLEKTYQAAIKKIKDEGVICGGKLVTPELWQKSHEEQQVFLPNFTAEAHRVRDDVFVAAVSLHKAFIDASAKQIRQNLGAFFYCLGNGNLPKDKQDLLPHLWSTGFLITPVISTAFASVGRMFKKLPQDTIGWLLIDEAGQATPQAAVGAICRARRVMSVGDPLQIEPVFPLPSTLVEGISKYIGVEPYHWMAPDASVQTLSDNANTYGTTIPRDLSEIRIGAPLLVHRRCENPMFKISNLMAYNGLMVHETISDESNLTKLMGGQTGWLHVNGSAQEKWSPEEGEQVAEILLNAFESFGAEIDIFVISPFRMVADHMSQRIKKEKYHLEKCGIDDPDQWIKDNIGTVHTFQGKEAQGVILLLGAPSPAQNGARSWATSNVNLLNVAVSRAKQNFYVVGNEKLWSDLGHMKTISRNIGSLDKSA